MRIVRRVRDRLTPLPAPFRLDPPSPGGFERIYHFHIRKCGGTSINRMVLASLSQNVEVDWQALRRQWRHRILAGGRPVVGWHGRSLESAAFFYGFSHLPVHALDLPERTFTFAMFRDPVGRVLSHYRMLLAMRRDNSSHVAFVKTERSWLGDNFTDFLDRIPREHLLNQLYMFSPRLNSAEAAEAARKLTRRYMFPDMLAVANDLSCEFGLALTPRKDNSFPAAPIDFRPTRAERGKLTDMLRDEFDLLDRIQLQL